MKVKGKKTNENNDTIFNLDDEIIIGINNPKRRKE